MNKSLDSVQNASPTDGWCTAGKFQLGRAVAHCRCMGIHRFSSVREASRLVIRPRGGRVRSWPHLAHGSDLIALAARTRTSSDDDVVLKLLKEVD